MDANESLISQLLEQSACEEAGLQIAILTIDEVVNNAAQTLYNHFLDSRIPSITSAKTMNNIFCQLQERTQNGSIPIDSELNPLWIPESEPHPPPIDVQASGFIETRRQQVSQSATSFKVPEAVDGKESSVSNSRRTSKRSVSRYSSIKVDIAVPSATQQSLTTEAIEPRRIPPEVEERERFRELHIKRLVRPKPTIAGAPIAVRAEVDPETEQLNRILEAAAGRPYTYDGHGAPIVIAGLRPDRLPSLIAETEVVVPPETPVPEPVPEKRKPKPKREKKNPATFYKPASDTQPTIAQTIVMAPGVTFKEGSVVKTGDKPPAVPLSVENMTLSQYRAYLEQESPMLEKKAPDSRIEVSRLQLPEGRSAPAARPASPSARFNELLLKDPNWGGNPDRPPDVKTTDTRLLTRANRALAKSPRMRRFIETSVPKKHLPHPMFPKSRGHEGRIPRPAARVQKSSMEKVRQAAREEVRYAKRIEKRGPPPSKIYTTPLAKQIFASETNTRDVVLNM